MEDDWCMKSDQDIIYEAVRDAWKERLQEINLYDIADLKEQIAGIRVDLNYFIKRYNDDTHSASSKIPKAERSLARVADASNDCQPKSVADIVRPTRASVQKISKTSSRRRRA